MLFLFFQSCKTFQNPITFDEAIKNYNKAVGKGILKVMNKIGISTLNSYRGSQLFECIGINTKVVEKYFPNTPTRIQGIGLYQIEKEIALRHHKTFSKKELKSFAMRHTVSLSE